MKNRESLNRKNNLKICLILIKICKWKGMQLKEVAKAI